MVKYLVTHIFPDLDAITACWLLKRNDYTFEKAQIKFVPAGITLDKQKVDMDPEIVHVDTGLGRFDHHQIEERTCAAKLVFEYLKQEKKIGKKKETALNRLIELVLQVDHFEDFFWEKPADDKYDLCLHHLFNYLKMSGRLNDRELVSQGFLLLDGLLFGLKEKIKAEEEIKEGIEFKTKWGRSIGMETKVNRVLKLAQKMGYTLILTKDPDKGFVAIKCQPKKELDLEEAYKALKEADKQADWFFHSSRHIILNGSRHNQDVKPSRLSLNELIDILRNIN